MKKLSVLMAAMLVVSGSVMAQGEETGQAGAGSGASAAGSGLGAIGGIATGTIVAGAIAAGVLAAVVSNNRSDSAPEEEEEVATCNPGDGNPSNGVCTGVTVTASGTSTATVTFTYPASVQ